jgi:hypothetical protein
MALQEGTCVLRQQDKQADEINFRESVEPEVFTRFSSFHMYGLGDPDGLLPVPKVKTEIGKKSLFYKGKTSLLLLIAASLLSGLYGSLSCDFAECPKGEINQPTNSPFSPTYSLEP